MVVTPPATTSAKNKTVLFPSQTQSSALAGGCKQKAKHAVLQIFFLVIIRNRPFLPAGPCESDGQMIQPMAFQEAPLPPPSSNTSHGLDVSRKLKLRLLPPPPLIPANPHIHSSLSSTLPSHPLTPPCVDLPSPVLPESLPPASLPLAPSLPRPETL